MKFLSALLGLVAMLLVIYAILGRFYGEPSVGGYIFPLDAKTVVLGANTLLLIAIFIKPYSCKK